MNTIIELFRLTIEIVALLFVGTLALGFILMFLEWIRR